MSVAAGGIFLSRSGTEDLLLLRPGSSSGRIAGSIRVSLGRGARVA